MNAHEMWELHGQTFAPHMGSLRNGIGRVDDRGWIYLSGEAVPSLNLAYVADGPGAESMLGDITELAVDRGLPVAILMSPTVSEQLATTAADQGFEQADSLPLLELEAAGRRFEQVDDARYVIVRATDEVDLADALDVQAATFKMPRDALGRVFGTSFIASSVFEVFTALRDGVAVSTVTTATLGGATGIWAMATLPDRQRQGAGRAVFTAALAHHTEHGVERFYLAASRAGRALYEHTGFVEVEDTRMWVTG